jgi:hypothetical protein
MSPSTIEDFNALEYVITIHPKESGYLVHLQELHLFVQHENLEIAHAELAQAKCAVMEKYFRAGISSKIPLPAEVVENQELKKIFNALFYQTGVLLVSAANISLSYSLQQAPKAIAQKAARVALKNFGATLE